MSYGRTFPLWRDACAPVWQDYTRHDFVAGLGSGSLPRENFLRYLVQDYLFLIQFSRAWALAVTKADTVADMRACAATVQALLSEELPLHIRICAEAGLPEPRLQQAEEAPATLAYTRFVLATGHAGDVLDLLAALAPCVLGYGEIGQRLSREAERDSPYRDWIDTYASPGYQQLCAEMGALLDGVAARRLGPAPEVSPRWGDLCQTFRTATRLEVGFWDMGLA